MRIIKQKFNKNQLIILLLCLYTKYNNNAQKHF
jgi:hypothetical protein